jgi:diadenosine tetraphosphate (Ap4A) HIT family hydrolase
MTKENVNCPFCNLDPDVHIWLEKETCIAIKDSFPVSTGHTLIIPKDHISSYFDLSAEVQCACWETVNEMKAVLEKKYRPDGFNVGINVGEASGQTISHVHIHLIPRYKGDMKNPRGGVRGVIPEKQSY